MAGNGDAVPVTLSVTVCAPRAATMSTSPAFGALQPDLDRRSAGDCGGLASRVIEVEDLLGGLTLRRHAERAPLRHAAPVPEAVTRQQERTVRRRLKRLGTGLARADRRERGRGEGDGHKQADAAGRTPHAPLRSDRGPAGPRRPRPPAETSGTLASEPVISTEIRGRRALRSAPATPGAGGRDRGAPPCPRRPA